MIGTDIDPLSRYRRFMCDDLLTVHADAGLVDAVEHDILTLFICKQTCRLRAGLQHIQYGRHNDTGDQRGLSEADYGLAASVNGIFIVLVGLPISQYLGRY